MGVYKHDEYIRASIMGGRKPAESSLAGREKKERECGTSVSRNGGLKWVDIRALRSHPLLYCSPSALAVCAAAKLLMPLLH